MERRDVAKRIRRNVGLVCALLILVSVFFGIGLCKTMQYGAAIAVFLIVGVIIPLVIDAFADGVVRLVENTDFLVEYFRIKK